MSLFRSINRGQARAAAPSISHVLLLSVDGMHAVDFANCSTGLSGVNGGNPYCPNLAALTGVNYVASSTSKPSDSFPGLMSIVSGGSPKSMGVYYDVALDRSLNPPGADLGQCQREQRQPKGTHGYPGLKVPVHMFLPIYGNPGGSCFPGAKPPGTTTEYDEGISFNKNLLNGGAPTGDGGVASLQPLFLVRDKSCNAVYPWNFVRVNTIFGVIHGNGGYTAWSDKHPSYSSVGGPTGTNVDTNVDDYYAPEINSNSQDYPSSDIKVAGCNRNASTRPVEWEVRGPSVRQIGSGVCRSPESLASPVGTSLSLSTPNRSRRDCRVCKPEQHVLGSPPSWKVRFHDWTRARRF